MKRKNKISKREHSNHSAYAFLFPYALLFFIFILVPVVMAIGLSFTNFNAIQKPKFIGF